MNEKKEKTKFQKFLILYSSLLLFCMVIFFIYVGISLVKYENNQIETYMENTLKEIRKEAEKGNIDTLVEGLESFKKSKYETNEIKTCLEEMIKNSFLTYKPKKNTEEPIYEIYAEDKLLFEITLKEIKKENRLGLFTFSIWKTDSIINKVEEGMYSYTIEVPSDYKVYINDLEVTDDYIKIEDTDSLEELAKYTNISVPIKYELKDFYKTPTIKIIDKEGKNTEYEQDGFYIKKGILTEKIKEEQEAIEKIKKAPDIKKIARDWSLYLTDDLDGKMHGYPTIKNYLVPNGNLQKFAYKWATDIDITFISNHTLDNPIFTNEKVENFEIFNENAFSCEVYLEKNMRVKGKKHKDSMHDKMYFVYLEDEWKLASMKSITGGEK